MPDQDAKKWLIFPLEIVEREASGKLVICQEALKRGWGCIIGTKKAVRNSIDHLPPGAIFLKSIITSELSYMQMFKERGHRLVCLDEEGLVQNSLDHMVSVRASDETLAELDAFMLWGKIQSDAYRKKYPSYQDKFHVVSNPRIDLWQKEKYRPLFEAEQHEIQKKYGDYFIIPTSFGTYNHFMGKDGALSIYKVDKMVPPEYFSFLEGYREYVKNIYYGFIDIIEPLSKRFPHMNIVIRPHPSENRKPWDKLAKKYDNVHVVFSGGVTPWLLGSKAILHCGSTTAVEGHLMGKPVISYCRNYNDPAYNLEVPANASINVTDADKVFHILEEVCSGFNVNDKYPEVAKGHEWLKQWIDGMNSYESSNKIMDILDSLPIKPHLAVDEVPQGNDTLSFKEFVWSAMRPLEYTPIIKDALPFRIKQGLRSRRYGKSKTKDIDVASLTDYINTLSDINKAPHPDVKVLGKNLVALS